MKSTPWHVSLLALALFTIAAPVQAAGTSESGTMVVAQATDGTQDFDAVRKFIAGGRNLSKLDADRLQQRLKRAEKFKEMAGLPPDLSAQLDEEIAGLNAEIAKRQQAGGATDGAANTNTGNAAGTADAGQGTAKTGAGQQQTADAGGSGDVDSFLQSVQPVEGLSDQQLRQQMRQAAQLSKSSGISGAQKKQLRDIVMNSRAEMQRRSSGGTGGTQQDGTTANAGDNAAGDNTAGNGKRNRKNQQTADNGTAGQTADNGQSGTGAASGTGNVDVFLQSVKPVSGLSDQELRQQMRQAAELSRSSGISADQKRQLREIIRNSRTEMQSRKGGNGNANNGNAGNDNTGNAGNGNAGQTGGNGQQTAGGSGNVDVFLQSAKPVSGLSDQDLRQQMRQAAELSRSAGISPDQKRQLREILKNSRAEMQNRKGGNGNANNGNGQNGNANNGANAGNGNANNNTAGNGTVDQGSEQRARVILQSNVDASKLDRAAQRQRLSDMRDLLQSNQLSPETKKALRQKLASERAILRGEVSGNKGSGNAGGDTTINIDNSTNTTINKDVVKVVVNDRRPGAQLRDDELRRRIDVLRVVVIDKSYSDVERRQWQAQLDADRIVMRDRLLKGKREREAKLKNHSDINIDLSLNFRPDRPVPPRSVFAAEADDSEITDILAAPPRRKIERRYTVNEVETNPQLRDAVARIEIDTVHFGFGEGFLREEEIDKLDRIAEVLEKILAKSPGEVFMIEGHTDAVGSDAANLDLSRQRAQAVKEALTTYYVIPEENLKTVGFGEKYLKIPTEDPEPENRRVSIARITPLVGELQ